MRIPTEDPDFELWLTLDKIIKGYETEAAKGLKLLIARGGSFVDMLHGRIRKISYEMADLDEERKTTYGLLRDCVSQYEFKLG